MYRKTVVDISRTIEDQSISMPFQYSALAVALCAALPASWAIALDSSATGAVHGRQIEVQGLPTITSEAYVGDAVSVTTLPTASDADSTDVHAGWRYVWQVDGADVGTEVETSALSNPSAISSFTIRAGDANKAVRVCLKAMASSGYPDATKLSQVACSNAISALPLGSAPVAGTPSIPGAWGVGDTLMATYSYSDADNDIEGGSIFQWYRTDDASGTSNKAAINGAIGPTYTAVAADLGKYLVFEVTPRSATGKPNLGAVAKAVSGQFIMPVMIGRFSGPDLIRRTWDEADSYCNGLLQHGYSDWRLPTRDELLALRMNYNVPAVPGWSTNINYWSSTVLAASMPNYHHHVDLNTGGTNTPINSYRGYVTCVR